MTGYSVLGEPVTPIGDETFVVTYPRPVTQQEATHLKKRWAELVGGRLIILDSGAKLSRLRSAETTPIYDELLAEYGDPFGGVA